MNNKLVPSIRFKEFTNAWEQRRVGDLFKITNGNPLDLIFINPNQTHKYKYPVFTSKTVNNGLAGYYDKYLFSDSITWTTDGYAGNVMFRPGKFYCTGHSGVLESINYANYANALAINKVAYKHVKTGAIPTLKIIDMKEIKFWLSPTNKECTKISALIIFLRKSISLLQCKLEKLKNLKNNLLEKMFADEKHPFPKIRFKEFTNDWEQRNFNDFYQFAAEGGTPSTHVATYYKNGNIPFVKIQDLECKYIFKTQNYITNKALKNSSAWLLKANNLLISNGATIGKISINKVDLTTKQGILGIVLKEAYSPEFLYFLLSTESFQNKIKKITVSSTIPTLLLKNLDKLRLNIPGSEKEQKRLTILLDRIEEYISLLQRKLEKMENIKNTLLQKMFV
ncbi:restriction endonuclease subunit S [Ureaplasma miroungigenitalium]|nr:restriction endonuclease subunit S [Ureaplasma miroungigenitalium]